MTDARATFLLAGVMAGVAVAGVVLTAVLLYDAALEEQTRLLQNIVSTRAALVESVARYDAAAGPIHGYDTAAAATLAQVREAHERQGGLGETGEFTMARRQDGRIHFLLALRHDGDGGRGDVAWDSSLAEPMKRALEGHSGTMIGRDYRGEQVLAAYQPVPALEAGMVAKIDLAEVRAPFIQAVAAACAALLLLVAFGTALVAGLTRRLEQGRRETERTIANLVTNFWGAIYRRLDAPGYPMVFISDHIRDLSGHPASAFTAGEVSYGRQVIHPDDQERVWAEVQQAVAEGRRFELTYRIVRRDGQVRFVREWGVPVPDPNSGQVYLEGYLEDITRWHEADQALRAMNQSLRTVSNGNAAVIRAGTEAELSEAICDILVREADCRMAWVALVPPGGAGDLERRAACGPGSEHVDGLLAWREEGTAVANQVLSKGATRVLQDLAHDPAYAPWREEARRNGLGSALLLPVGGDGAVLGVMGIYAAEPRAFGEERVRLLEAFAGNFAFGVAARRAHRALAESEARLKSLVESSADPLLVVDEEGIITFANTAAAGLFGRPRERLTGSAFGLATAQDDMFTADVIRGDGTTRRAEGRVRQVSWAGRPGQLVNLRDVTERERRASEQHRQRELLQRILDTIPAFVLWTGLDGVFRGGNQAFATVAGLESPAALEGRSMDEMPFTAEEAARARRLIAEVAANGEAGGPSDEVCHLADGRVAEVLCSRVPLRDEAGAVSGVLLVGVDVTSHREAERHLRQAQKMEAVGNLTGGVAHDFNNLLGVVLGNLQLMERRLTAPEAAVDSRVTERLKNAIEAVERGADLTRRLLAFARRQVLEPKVVDLNELVAGMDKLLGRTLGETIDIQVAPTKGLWMVSLDPGQLESALLNLAINARDAMPQGGTLTIETANVTLEEQFSEAKGYAAPGHYAMLAVSDTGSGMEPEVVEQAFEPFFTTKGSGKGSGLGLSMVYGFVKQSGGLVSIYSEPAEGTSVKLYFPRVEREREVMEQAAREGELQGGTERLLVVEDAEDLRRTSSEYLRALGYEVTEAGSGPEALAALDADPAIALVFTDLVMPGGMDGVELAKQAKARVPGLKVLLTSGYARDALTASHLKGLDAELLGKPYRLDDVGRAVRRHLDHG